MLVWIYISTLQGPTLLFTSTLDKWIELRYESYFKIARGSTIIKYAHQLPCPKTEWYDSCNLVPRVLGTRLWFMYIVTKCNRSPMSQNRMVWFMYCYHRDLKTSIYSHVGQHVWKVAFHMFSTAWIGKGVGLITTSQSQIKAPTFLLRNEILW